MKLLVFASLALAACAAPVVDEELPANAWTKDAPQGFRIASRLDQSAAIDGAKRKEILYGPYEVPPGKMISKVVFQAEKPCTNCYVTAMQATIRHTDGREALTSEGFWLHHTVLVGGPQGTIWAAGNERPTLRLNSQYKYGIDWPSSLYSISVDLMSEAKVPMNLSLSILYEYIEKSSPQGKEYKGSYLRWNQIGFPAAKEGVYTFNSTVWTSPLNGKLLYAIGHMHDGGTDIQLYVNKNLVCKSVMRYGGRPGYGGNSTSTDVAKPAMGGHSHSKRDGPHGGAMSDALHISDPGLCENFGAVKKGDAMTIKVTYDTTKYPLMMHNGNAERLMGNMRVYIGPEA